MASCKTVSKLISFISLCRLHDVGRNMSRTYRISANKETSLSLKRTVTLYTAHIAMLNRWVHSLRPTGKDSGGSPADLQ
jgi:hypothetical protein